MMNMMYTTGSGFFLLWMLHTLAVSVFAAGVILLILWAVKTLTPSQLKTWGIGLVIAGTLACLFTIGVRGGPWIGAFGSGNGMMDGEMSGMRMMHEMMDDHDMDDDSMMEMSMSDMSGMLEGKTGDAFDSAFIEGMIPHHQGAIDMARAALTSAKHEEIRQMARDIISAQQREIDMMKQWQRDWGYAD